ncbi:hypothetical protein EV643_1415 [Kribbella sp. VKM Ac-2527]|uniref:ScoMcrA-like N-terminal head domain-containing protein n=1 Tax=Kribbella caucasensis TaxID=2512215 RepID=A0A4R6J3U5_9ACTN|nr:hypothetical protein [Kribbella sp. VKM Ac-2527]TDO30030.1 hypothetical protein EV643_1415 [Kribbella sp. VKM Ac-2527]
MPNFDAVAREHVLRALEEYDELGADEFLTLYGFGKAREYLLWHDGKSYDSKAILGVSYLYAAGTAATSSEFSGGKDGAARILRKLGFSVTFVDDPELAESPGSGSWREASDVGSESARSAWAEAARAVLLEAAGRYRAVVTYKELATQVMNRTGIHTRQLMHYWIGDVLGRVSAESSRRGEPLLSSLCVNAAGSVGEGYAIAVQAAEGVAPGDLDDHATHERLACYRHFNAAGLPPGGGVAALTPKLRESKDRARRAKTIQKTAPQCPTYHISLPATGVCDFCD